MVGETILRPTHRIDVYVRYRTYTRRIYRIERPLSFGSHGPVSVRATNTTQLTPKAASCMIVLMNAHMLTTTTTTTASGGS